MGAKGLETLLEITVGMDGNLDAMNIVSSLLEIISAYQGIVTFLIYEIVN